jgi:hypothetical protein
MPPRSNGQRYLRFDVQISKAGGLVLAEPLDIRYAGLEAEVGKAAPSLPLFQAIPGADAVKSYMPSRGAPYTYLQVVTESDAMERMPARFHDDAYRDYLTGQPVPEPVATWARERLGQLPQLTPEQRRLDAEGHVSPEHHAAVSAAFRSYFALSGDYRYSLTLKRRTRIDPTADFLLHVKAGHCERFAAALALSLRGLGVPTRIIKGYRGADEQQTGKYVVRLDQAHSWVQVLVRDGDGWVWLTLDPTPGDDDARHSLAGWIGWLSDVDPQYLWRRYVLNYNGDVQASALWFLWQSAASAHLLWQIPALGATVALAVGAWRRRRRLAHAWRRQRVPQTPAYYQRLLRVLARRFDLRPALGQTPLEFAQGAGAVLGRHATTTAWSALPEQAARVLYRLRFAGCAPAAADEAALATQITALERAAKQRRT